MLAPESEVLPGQVSSSLFGGLKARGGSVRDLHLHLHAAGPATVAAVVCPEAPVSLHSSISASKLFPKAACQWRILPKLWEEQCGMGGVCVGAEVILTAPARDWSCSQSCAHTRPLMLQEECGLMSFQSATGLHLGQLTWAIN